MAILPKTQHLTPFRGSEASLRHSQTPQRFLELCRRVHSEPGERVPCRPEQDRVSRLLATAATSLTKTASSIHSDMGLTTLLNNLPACPQFQTSVAGALGDSNSQYRRYGTWFLADTLSWVKGRHTIKVGGEFRYIFENGYDDFGSRPDCRFYRLWKFRHKYCELPRILQQPQ